MADMTQQEFFSKYDTLISRAIKNNNVCYTIEKMSMYRGHRYYINTKDVYIFALKMLDPTYINSPRYMFYAEIKKDNVSQKICGDSAKKHYIEMVKKYRKILNAPNNHLSSCFLGDKAYRRSKTR